jgi:sulfatase modifying factor 1
MTHSFSARRCMTAIVMLIALARNAGAVVTLDMVTVGDLGNAKDSTGFGSVSYEYQIEKYEVTIGQYAEFLNAVAKTDQHGLYSPSMGSDKNIAGISQSGDPGAYVYKPIGPYGITPPGADSADNRPITVVSWFDAARFANWMTNGQGAVDTENGSYTLNGSLSGTAAERVYSGNLEKRYYILDENEWYKAACFSPTLNSGSGGYWSYATQSNQAPGNDIGSSSNQAYYFTNGRYSVTESSRYFTTQNYLTNVGAFENSSSFYRTFDQSGNAAE